MKLQQRIAEQFPDVAKPAPNNDLSGDHPELVLAWAAGLGSPAAIRQLEPMFHDAETHLRSRGYSADVASEAVQRARVALLTGEASIFSFTGRGALGAFIRVVCVRHALNQARDATRAVQLEELGAAADAPELDVFRNQYRDQVNRAMTAAWQGLTKHDRFVLSLHLHAKHSIAEIAKVYGIHRVNAARKLAAARTALIRGTRLVLQGELGVSSSTASSVLRLTSFDLTVDQLAPATGVGR